MDLLLYPFRLYFGISELVGLSGAWIQLEGLRPSPTVFIEGLYRAHLNYYMALLHEIFMVKGIIYSL